MKPFPPDKAIKFLRWFCREDYLEEIEGDLVEIFENEYGEKPKKAKRRFTWNVIRYFRPGFVKSFGNTRQVNSLDMFRNYFKIGWRNLLKNRGYSTINILGLSAGMTVAILIGLWIWDELSFDSYFKNRDQLAQVMLNQTDKGETYTDRTIAMPLGDALRTLYSDEFKRLSLTSGCSDYILISGDKKLSATGMWVQSDFPEMFTLKMVRGSREALKGASTVLLSISVAKAIFGDLNPLDQAIRINNKFDVVVGGVFEDFPMNTTFFATKVFLPWDNQENWMNRQTSWSNHCGELFVQLNDNFGDIAEVSEKIRSVPTPHIAKIKEEIMLYPLNKLHLYDEFESGKGVGGRIEFVWLFGTIGVFVLLLACINFMNLSTARSEKRAKEVGIRKTIGSVRRQLVGQFLSESMLVTLLAFVLCMGMTQFSLPFFNVMSEKQIQIPWNSPGFWGLLVSFTFFTGIISGSYPAFFLSAFKPLQVLKSTYHAGVPALLLRKVLVVVQFTVSITLIISTIIVFRQIEYAKSRTPGYSREGLVAVRVNTPEIDKHYDVVKNELFRAGVVDQVARSSYSPAHFSSNNSVEWQGKDPELVAYFRNVNVTPEFGITLGWKITEGRDFIANSPADSTSVIFNQTAIEIMGNQNPIGKEVTFRGKQYTIVGVIEDMVTQSPYSPIEPAMFFTDGWKGVILMRMNANMPISKSLDIMESVFKKYNPTAPFQYSFVDDDYARKYSNEQRIGTLAAFFAVLAIFISCLGLFGLASFVAEQRTNEIGIRKILGATVVNLWNMLTKEFLILVGISCAVAIPISYIFLHNWLQNYEYHTGLEIWVFVIACSGTLMITLFTVSYQSIKAATMNPVDSLRNE